MADKRTNLHAVDVPIADVGGVRQWLSAGSPVTSWRAAPQIISIT